MPNLKRGVSFTPGVRLARLVGGASAGFVSIDFVIFAEIYTALNTLSLHDALPIFFNL